MKNFKKRAVFASLLGAMSITPSFAGNSLTVDNANLYKSNIQKRCKFLNIKDYDLNNPKEKATLKEVFKQIATIYYENFGGNWKKPLNPSVIENKRRMQINNENIIKILNEENIEKTDKYIPKRGVVNPIYNLNDEPTKQRLINSKSRSDFERFTSGAGNGTFLVHTDKKGIVDGFVDLSLLRNNGIYINFLATKADKLRQGIGEAMIKELQKQYNYIELLPSNQNAADFYKHFGFKMHSYGMVWNKI